MQATLGHGEIRMSEREPDGQRGDLVPGVHGDLVETKICTLYYPLCIHPENIAFYIH
jgi:hypothetical protein